MIDNEVEQWFREMTASPEQTRLDEGLTEIHRVLNLLDRRSRRSRLQQHASLRDYFARQGDDPSKD
jgi:hypothetical protein